MRILYIAGTADDDSALLESTEATELALLFHPSGGANLEFTALPDVPLHLLRGMIRRFEPDVLHLAAHGAHGVLRLRDDVGRAAAVTAQTLQAFLPTATREGPALLYLNACDSAQIAADLKDVVPAAIGFEGKVSNATAHRAALIFYSEILAGESIISAHKISARYVEAAPGSGGAKSILTQREPARSVHLCVPLTVLARFDEHAAIGGGFGVQLGLEGVPQEVAQIVFLLIEPTLEDQIRILERDPQLIERGLASSFCRVITRPRRHERMWTAAGYTVRADCNIYAMLTFADGRVATASARLGKALERYASQLEGEESRRVFEAIARLRQG